MAPERPTEAWLIKYEDPDHQTEVFSGWGGEESARRRFVDISTSWNATLFASIGDNFSVPASERPPDQVTALRGKLRVIEGFIGSIIRWYEQPGVNLKDEMRRVETATREALTLLGCEVGKPAETKPLANYRSPTLDDQLVVAWIAAAKAGGDETSSYGADLARAKRFLARLQELR